MQSDAEHDEHMYEPDDNYDALADQPKDGPVFEGDFFGSNYDDNDFPGFSENEEPIQAEFFDSVPSDSDVEEEEDNMASLDYSDSDDEDEVFEENFHEYPTALQ